MRTRRARIVVTRRPWWLARRRFVDGKMTIDDTNIVAMNEMPNALIILTGRGMYRITGREPFTVRPA